MTFSLRHFRQKKIKKSETLYLVKWENYEAPTWEPMKNIPQFIINYYEETGNSGIPSARVKHIKIVGK